MGFYLSLVFQELHNKMEWRKEEIKLYHGKVNDESFHITFFLLGICPRDSILHSKYDAIQVSTKDTQGNVDRSETYFKSYPHMGVVLLIC